MLEQREFVPGVWFTPYLLFADALVRVVQLVREDLSIASEGFVPAERNGGRRVGHPLQVRSRAGHLDW